MLHDMMLLSSVHPHVHHVRSRLLLSQQQIQLLIVCNIPPRSPSAPLPYLHTATQVRYDNCVIEVPSADVDTIQ